VRLEQRAVQLAFLDEIGQQIANLLDLDEVLKKVVNFVQRAFDYHQTSVFVIDQERDAAILKAQAGSLTDLPSDHSIPLGEGLVGWVGCHGRAKVVNGERAERWYANDDLDVSSIRSELAVPIQVHGETWGVLNIQSPCRDGLEEDDILVMNTVADRLSVAVENAQLYDTVKREQRALEQHIERLEILHSVDQAILGAKSVEDVAQVVLGRVWEVVPACWWGSLTLFDFDTGKLQLMAFRCDADVAIETGSRYSLASWKDFIPKLEQGEPIILEDIREVMGRSEDIQELYVEGLRSVITVPMGYQGELLGILTLGSNEVEGLGAEYLPVAKEIADSVATMIHQADLLDSLSLRQEQLRILMRRLSEAEEAQRRSLARILHNQIGQSLTALGLNLNVVKSQLDAETAVRVDERLDDSLNLVDEMADHIRSMIADLRPPMLEDYGLVAALDWYSKKVSSRVDMDITVASEREDVRLPEKIEMALFRIAQEALTNTLKHAQASQITITVTLDEDVVRLVIADDGIGFNVNERPAPDDEQSWGLLNMRERAEAVGGRCHIESYPGEGTRIIVEVRR
jgi:signal transduction histidine kinase